MPVLQPDTSAAEDFSLPIPEGNWPFKIVACTSGKSKAGNDKIMPKLEITVEGKKRTRTAHLNISGEGSIGFDQLLRSVGMSDLADAYHDPLVSPKPGFDTDSLVGCEGIVIVGTQMYNDQPRDQINGFLRK